jgi:uncharacterized protein YecT (DUF1311 family)
MTHSRTRYVFLFLFSISGLPLDAKPGPDDPRSADDCTDLPQQHATACIAHYFRRVDNDMNLIYRELRTKLGPKERELIQKAQLSWIGFRDHTCDFEGLKNEGGSLQPFTIGVCMVTLTEQRIKDLSESLKYYNELPARGKSR